MILVVKYATKMMFLRVYTVLISAKFPLPVKVPLHLQTSMTTACSQWLHTLKYAPCAMMDTSKIPQPILVLHAKWTNV